MVKWSSVDSGSSGAFFLVVTCSTANAKSSSGVEGRCFFTSRRRRRSVEGAAWGRGVGEVPRKFGWLVVYVWLNSMVYGRYNELVNENYNDYQWLIWLVVFRPTPLKNITSSDGMMTIYGKIKVMFQSTNQLGITSKLNVVYQTTRDRSKVSNKNENWSNRNARSEKWPWRSLIQWLIP